MSIGRGGPLEHFVFHACISGRSQTGGKWNGTAELGERLRQEGHCNGVWSRVQYFRWDHDWSDAAEQLAALRLYYSPANMCIKVYGYSWGGGWGAVRLATELGRRGMRVARMVLCDAVFRHPNWWMAWQSLRNWDWGPLRAPSVVVPDSVDEVHSFRQKRNRPRGHRIRAADPTLTRVEDTRVLAYEHAWIDGSSEYHDLVLDLARRDFASFMGDELDEPGTSVAVEDHGPDG